jgi:drug/metabolite transporter (DMT)-like permease
MQTKVHPAVSGAVQQLAVGLVSLIPALALPQPEIHFSWRGMGALLYLVAFGSIVGYTSFVYAMAHLPVALVSIYMYINPVVAVILGALIFGESVGVREIAAMGVIFLGSAMVKWFTRKKPAPPSEPQPEPSLTAAR